MLRLTVRAAVLAAVCVSVGAASPRSPLCATPDRGCKPLAPLAVELTAREPSAGPVVTLDLGMRPVLGMQSVEWRLQLSDGLSLLAGASDGFAEPERGAVTAGVARVVLPADGRHVRATLVVTGTFLGHDETGASSLETVQVERSLSWGEPATPGKIVVSADLETGAPAAFVAVPATTTPSTNRAGR